MVVASSSHYNSLFVYICDETPYTVDLLSRSHNGVSIMHYAPYLIWSVYDYRNSTKEMWEILTAESEQKKVMHVYYYY